MADCQFYADKIQILKNYRLLEVEKRNCNLMNENNDNALLKGESLLKTHLRFNANNNNNNNNSNVQKGEIYNASNGIDKRPADLVRRFGDLYSMARLDTLDALDNVNELDQFFTSQTSSTSSATNVEVICTLLLPHSVIRNLFNLFDAFALYLTLIWYSSV